jgi:hypothetical protein
MARELIMSTLSAYLFNEILRHFLLREELRNETIPDLDRDLRQNLNKSTMATVPHRWRHPRARRLPSADNRHRHIHRARGARPRHWQRAARAHVLCDHLHVGPVFVVQALARVGKVPHGDWGGWRGHGPPGELGERVDCVEEPERGRGKLGAPHEQERVEYRRSF